MRFRQTKAEQLTCWAFNIHRVSFERFSLLFFTKKSQMKVDGCEKGCQAKFSKKINICANVYIYIFVYIHIKNCKNGYIIEL